MSELTNLDAGSIGRKLLLLLAVAGMVLPAAAGGAVVATETATSTTTDTTDGVTLPTNQTVTLTNQTTDVWVEVGNATGTVNATVYGVDAGGNETKVGTVTLNATGGANDTAMKEVAINATAYESARVELTDDASDNTTATVETFDAGVMSKLAGGGDGDSGGSILDGMVSVQAIVSSLVAAGLLLLAGIAVREG